MTEFIDFSKVYRIEAIPSKNSKELAEKGIGSLPGTMQYVTASWNDSLKRYERTGFDENSSEIMRLPSDKRAEVKERIKSKREELESLIGKEGYLKPTSDAWVSSLCMGHIEVGQDLKVRVNGHTNELNPAQNYKDAILLSLIMNNPNFPKSKADLGKPEYRDAKFVLTTEDETGAINKTQIQKTRKANLRMSELFDNGKNKQRAWEVAFKLGLVSKQKVDVDVLEIKMQNAIFNDKTFKTLELFLEACELDNDILLIHNLFQQALIMGIIKVSKDGYYNRGAINYRKTKSESIAYLLAPGNEIELGELKSEVEGRKKKHNAIG